MAEHYFNFQEKELLPSATPGDIEENWLWALISYIGPVFLIVLMIKRDSAFAIYHAWQAMGLFIAAIAWFFLWIIINFVVPAEIKFALLAVTTIFIAGFFGIFALWVTGIINVFRGAMKPIELFGKYFEKR